MNTLRIRINAEGVNLDGIESAIRHHSLQQGLSWARELASDGQHKRARQAESSARAGVFRAPGFFKAVCQRAGITSKTGRNAVWLVNNTRF